MTDDNNSIPREKTGSAGWLVTVAGLVGALAMTSCCILPLVLVSLGVTGVFIGQLTALYAYKWAMFGFAAAALGYGFWKAYRPAPAAECRDGTCTRPIDRTLMRSVLWGATGVVLLTLAFPAVAPLLLTF